MKKLNFLLFLALLLTVACEKESSLHDPMENLSETETRNAIPRRFHGISTMQTAGRLGPEGRCAAIHPTFVTVLLEGAGQFAHLGHTQVTVSQCADVTGAVRSPLDFFDSEVVFTAANGDEVLASGEGSLVPTGTPGVFDIDGEIFFEGGTGRFEGAYGNARLDGRVIFANFPPQPGDPPADITNRYSGFIYY